MRRDAEQHVLEIGERRDVDQVAALDERVQQRRAASPFKAASKEPVLPADRDESELILGAVVVDGHAAILDEALERCPLIGLVSDGVAERRFWQDGPRERLPLRVDLGEQRDGLLLTQRPTSGGI